MAALPAVPVISPPVGTFCMTGEFHVAQCVGNRQWEIGQKLWPQLGGKLGPSQLGFHHLRGIRGGSEAKRQTSAEVHSHGRELPRPWAVSDFLWNWKVGGVDPRRRSGGRRGAGCIAPPSLRRR